MKNVWKPTLGLIYRQDYNKGERVILGQQFRIQNPVHSLPFFDQRRIMRHDEFERERCQWCGSEAMTMSVLMQGNWIKMCNECYVRGVLEPQEELKCEHI